MDHVTGPEFISGASYFEENGKKDIDSEEVKTTSLNLTKLEKGIYQLADQLTSIGVTSQEIQSYSQKELEIFSKKLQQIIKSEIFTNPTNQVNLLIIPDNIDNLKTDLNEAESLRRGAEQKGTLVVSYSPEKTTLKELRHLISTKLVQAGELQADNIAFASHGSSGEFKLTKNQPITKESLSENGGNNLTYMFWEDMQDLIKKGGRIDLLGCKIGALEKGKALIKELENITGVTIAASTTITGHSRLGGDWRLETENNLNVGALYFDPFFIKEWEHRLTDNSIQSINTLVEAFSQLGGNLGFIERALLPENQTPLIPESLEIMYPFSSEVQSFPITVSSNTITNTESTIQTIENLPEEGTLYQYDENETDHKGVEITETLTVISDELGRVIYETQNGEKLTDTFQFSSSRVITEEGETFTIPSSSNGMANLVANNLDEDIPKVLKSLSFYAETPSVVTLNTIIEKETPLSYTLTKLPSTSEGTIYQYDATQPDYQGKQITTENPTVTDSSGRIVAVMSTAGTLNFDVNEGEDALSSGSLNFSTITLPVKIDYFTENFTSIDELGQTFGKRTLQKLAETLSLLQLEYFKIFLKSFLDHQNTVTQKQIQNLKNYLISSHNTTTKINAELNTTISSEPIYNTMNSNDGIPLIDLLGDKSLIFSGTPISVNDLPTSASLTYDEFSTLPSTYIPITTHSIDNSRPSSINLEITRSTNDLSYKLFKYNIESDLYEEVIGTNDTYTIAGQIGMAPLKDQLHPLYIVPTVLDGMSVPENYSFNINYESEYTITVTEDQLKDASDRGEYILNTDR